MPIIWNLDVINRNQIIISCLLLCFCPWPLLTIFFVLLLAGPINEWEEERIGSTMDEFFDLYLELYGFPEEDISGILASQDKYWNIEIQQATTDYDLAHGDEIYAELKKEHDEMLRLKKQGKLKRTAFYEYWNETYNDINELSVARMDHIIYIMEHARRDWDTIVPLHVPRDNFTLDSFDYYCSRLLRKEFSAYLQELRKRGLRCENPGATLAGWKKTRRMRWYMHSHVNLWLNAFAFREELFPHQDDLQREFKKIT